MFCPHVRMRLHAPRGGVRGEAGFFHAGKSTASPRRGSRRGPAAEEKTNRVFHIRTLQRWLKGRKVLCRSTVAGPMTRRWTAIRCGAASNRFVVTVSGTARLSWRILVLANHLLCASGVKEVIAYLVFAQTRCKAVSAGRHKVDGNAVPAAIHLKR